MERWPYAILANIPKKACLANGKDVKMSDFEGGNRMVANPTKAIKAAKAGCIYSRLLFHHS